MYITSQDQVITDLRWWKQMRVDGDQIIVQMVPEEGIEPSKVVLVELKDKEAIQALFKELNEGIFACRRKFDVGPWIEEYQEAASGE